MSLRDILVFAVVFGGVPFMIWRPYIGVFYWVWLGVMAPHRLTWGVAFDFQFSLVVGIATLLGLVFTTDERRWKGGTIGFLLIVFMVWMSITTLFAFHTDSAGDMWERVVKIQLMTWVSLLVLNSRRHINLLVWILVVSIGFYSVKGGLFTLRGGGENRVWGPDGSFIQDNNGLALAAIMIIPLMYYLVQVSKPRWVKIALIGAMILTAAGVLGSHSRGALVAIAAMAMFLWFKSPGKILSGLLITLVGAALVSFMPDAWWARMGTIGSYEEDASAMGRINTWHTAFNIAKERVVGGGYEYYWPDVFAKYAPNPEDLHSAHSIYFQVLGEHGFIGLFLFLLIWWLAWRCAGWIGKNTRDQEQVAWARHLGPMNRGRIFG